MYIDLLDNLLSYNIMINIIVRNAIKYDSFMQGKKTSLNSKKKTHLKSFLYENELQFS